MREAEQGLLPALCSSVSRRSLAHAGGKACLWQAISHLLMFEKRKSFLLVIASAFCEAISCFRAHFWDIVYSKLSSSKGIFETSCSRIQGIIAQNPKQQADRTPFQADTRAFSRRRSIEGGQSLAFSVSQSPDFLTECFYSDKFIIAISRHPPSGFPPLFTDN